MVLLIATEVILCGDLFSQDNQVKYSRQKAIDDFSKGDYEQAYFEFSGLLQTYSRDPLYKYYSGVCLVKLGREPEKASALLNQAIEGVAIVKPVPTDALFYLGRAQQMSGDFAGALKSYRDFTAQAGKKLSETYNVSSFIQQCNEKKGQLIKDEVKITDNLSKKETGSKAEDQKRIQERDTRQEIVYADIRKDILPEAYEKTLNEAIDYQVKADSLKRVIAENKKALERIPETEKALLRSRIAENELLADSYQKIADQKYNEAHSSTMGKQQPAPVLELKVKTTDDSSPPDKVPPVSEGMDIKDASLPASIKTEEVFSVFSINPNTVYRPEEKISIDPEMPGGLIYRIQVAVFRNPVALSFFKGISPVYGIKMAATGNTNYFAGMFRKMGDARKALESVKQTGFNDAFIVAVFNGKPVSPDRALLLEKEWGSKPLMVTSKQGPPTTEESTPPTLSFRVEVTRSVIPLGNDQVETYKKLAGNRGLEIVATEDNKIVYLIGKFITFESASEYASLLVRNGYRDAKVVAWLGHREIPVETARQLFEKLE
jgi:tetratricopeptide (TPR) repeat protein